MVFLLFHIGRDQYALDVRRVVEVLPLVTLKKIPRAPAGIAGVFDYRGAPVPVIDLAELTTGRVAESRLGTRIVLVEYRGNQRLGLIAEKATEILRREAADFTAAGVASDAAPYLGPVATGPRGLIQRIEVDALLPESVHAALFREPVAG